MSAQSRINYKPKSIFAHSCCIWVCSYFVLMWNQIFTWIWYVISIWQNLMNTIWIICKKNWNEWWKLHVKSNNANYCEGNEREKTGKNPHKLVVVVMSHVSKSGDTTSACRSFHIQILVHARSIQDPFEGSRNTML